MTSSKAGACTIVGKGGVGESGASSMLHHHYTEKINRLMVVRNAQSSLCPNTGAVAILVIDGRVAASGVLTSVGDSIQAEVGPSENVIAIVHTFPLFNDINCIRLGELEFTLEECELVG